MLDHFNKGRFDTEIFGFLASSANGTVGVLLAQQNGDITEILEVDAQEAQVRDGLVRATISHTMRQGALTFSTQSAIILGESFSLEKDTNYNIEEFFARGCNHNQQRG